MVKVTVYRFKVWDFANDKYVIQPRAAPMTLIEQHQWTPLKETAIEVELSCLDRDGMYLPTDEESK